MRIAVVIALFALVGCVRGADPEPEPYCRDATHVLWGDEIAPGVPRDFTCLWECTTKAGHPVAFSREKYERAIDGGYVLTESETLAGICVD